MGGNVRHAGILAKRRIGTHLALKNKPSEPKYEVPFAETLAARPYVTAAAVNDGILMGCGE